MKAILSKDYNIHHKYIKPPDENRYNNLQMRNSIVPKEKKIKIYYDTFDKILKIIKIKNIKYESLSELTIITIDNLLTNYENIEINFPSENWHADRILIKDDVDQITEYLIVSILNSMKILRNLQPGTYIINSNISDYSTNIITSVQKLINLTKNILTNDDYFSIWSEISTTCERFEMKNQNFDIGVHDILPSLCFTTIKPRLQGACMMADHNRVYLPGLHIMKTTIGLWNYDGYTIEGNCIIEKKFSYKGKPEIYYDENYVKNNSEIYLITLGIIEYNLNHGVILVGKAGLIAIYNSEFNTYHCIGHFRDLTKGPVCGFITKIFVAGIINNNVIFDELNYELQSLAVPIEKKIL